MLARMVWGTYAVKIEVQIGNCLNVEGSKMLARVVLGNCNHVLEEMVLQCYWSLQSHIIISSTAALRALDEG